MAQVLSERIVKALPAPTAGNRIFYDMDVRGFGVRVTYAGARSYILNFRARGRERRITIGSHPDWSVQAARDEAKRLKRAVDVGDDPMEVRHAERAAATVAEVAERYLQEHVSTLRPKTRSEYESMLRRYVLPELGTLRLTALTPDDVKRLHDRVKARYPYRANRLVTLVASMTAWSGVRTDNPARGVNLCPEEERERFLSQPEIDRVCDALDLLPNQVSADALRLMLLSGARKMAACKARWREFALDDGIWTIPAANMKSGRKLVAPLADVAIALLTSLRDVAAREGRGVDPSDFVFPGKGRGGHLGDVKRAWQRVTETAGIGSYEERADARGRVRRRWTTDVRPHDLRHTFASLAGAGSPLAGRRRPPSRPSPDCQHHAVHALRGRDVARCGQSRGRCGASEAWPRPR